MARNKQRKNNPNLSKIQNDFRLQRLQRITPLHHKIKANAHKIKNSYEFQNRKN